MKEVHAESGVELGADPDHAAEIVKMVVEAMKFPIIPKLTPQTANMVQVVRQGHL